MTLNKAILAGMFARSNMGHEVKFEDVFYTVRDERRNMERPRGAAHTAVSAMYCFCAELIEADEHEEMFEGEATMWEQMLAPMTDDDIRKTWPHITDLLDEAEAQLNSGQAAPCA